MKARVSQPELVVVAVTFPSDAGAVDDQEETLNKPGFDGHSLRSFACSKKDAKSRVMERLDH